MSNAKKPASSDRRSLRLTKETVKQLRVKSGFRTGMAEVTGETCKCSDPSVVPHEGGC